MTLENSTTRKNNSNINYDIKFYYLSTLPVNYNFYVLILNKVSYLFLHDNSVCM